MTTRRLDALTDRQRQVIALVADGHTFDGIAQRLGVERHAVKAAVNAAGEALGIPPCGHRITVIVARWIVWTGRWGTDGPRRWRATEEVA